MLSSATLLIIAFFAIVIDYIVVDYRKDKALFEMYRNRDRLYILALQNENPNDEIKYKYLQMRITRQISLLKYQIPIVSIINTTNSITCEDKKEASKLIESIKNDPKLYEIYNKCNIIFEKRLNENTFLCEYLLLKPMAFVLGIVIQIQRRRNISKNVLKKRRKKYNMFRQFSEDISSVFKLYSTF